MENLKMKEKKAKLFFDLPERGFELQIFSNFPAHDLNFHGREGDEIKSKQASKRDRTLLFGLKSRKPTIVRCKS